MRLLELFSGTGSVGKVFRARGWEVVSVDIDPKMQPTLVADIATFDFRALGGALRRRVVFAAMHALFNSALEGPHSTRPRGVGQARAAMQRHNITLSATGMVYRKPTLGTTEKEGRCFRSPLRRPRLLHVWLVVSQAHDYLYKRPGPALDEAMRARLRCIRR